MPRNQWSRRKSSTKPEDGGPPVGGRTGSSPRKIALDILARREHSVAELREKLAAREFPPDEIEQTLSALTEDGLLSEPRFIDSFLVSYTRRGHGPLWLRAELERRGIDAARISAALAGQAVDWVSHARTVREKRFGPDQPADYKDRARQSRFLQYRGFTSEHIRQTFSGDDED
jgi:regulatory protein